jgi:hypothetical protein
MVRDFGARSPVIGFPWRIAVGLERALMKACLDDGLDLVSIDIKEEEEAVSNRSELGAFVEAFSTPTQIVN